MTRFARVAVAVTAALAALHSAAYAAVPLGVPLGNPLGTPLPFAGGGVLAVAAAAVVLGIFVKHRKR